ncbi:hypothetical protein [Acinetobacter modestus]|uniref:hypothetical protein n=1 Tax=Acinetobacter modestus TaxID=1776740 RepID=UPI00301AEBF5
MGKAKPCGNCHSCQNFNGRDGNGYQPFRRPVPPIIEAPPIQIIDLVEPSDSDPWARGLYLGALIGFGFGIVFIKIITIHGF